VPSRFIYHQIKIFSAISQSFHPAPVLLLRLCLFWLLISVHVVGGAALFHRRFPRESPWFGFLVPSVAFVLILNVVEHAVGLPTLVWLLPFTLGVTLWSLLAPGLDWKKLGLPAIIFLVAFAFTLAQRALKPDILQASSGTYDLTLLSSFCMGSTVPPAYSLFPPHSIAQYYTFLPYSGSVLTRLLNLDVGTGFNLSAALVSAWTCQIMAGIAWRLSRQKMWITILAALLVECAANGSSAYVVLSNPNGDPVVTSDLFIGMDNPDYHLGIFRYLQPTGDFARRELTVPGFWSWLGTFHATCGGTILTLLTVQAMGETLRRRATNWSWICLGASPLLMLITSTWGLPIVAPLTLLTFACCAYYRLPPENPRFVLLALGLIIALLEPTYSEFLTSNIIPIHGIALPDTHTQLVEFLLYWWPIYLPWFALLLAWHRMAIVTRIIWVLLPVFYFSVEYYNVGQRTDMTGKLWGFIWAAGWSVFFPTIALQRGKVFRTLTGVLVMSSLVSLGGWTWWTWKTAAPVGDSLHLEGTGALRTDPLKLPLLLAADTMKGKILLTGRTWWSLCDSPALACFTHNYSYINGSTYCDAVFCPGTQGEAFKRDNEVTDFYNGKTKDPLIFLREHNIAAVVIFPDDQIADNVVEQLKHQLWPSYFYRDFRGDGTPNSGIFIFNPGLASLPPGTQPSP
jgi:hypothetical protein